MNRFFHNISWITGIIFSLILSIPGISQMDCDIVIDSPIPVCPDGHYTLSVPEDANWTYTWRENGNLIPDTDTSSINVVIESETSFSISIVDDNTQENCMSDLYVTTHPDFEIEFKQWQLTCTNGDEPNGNNAKVQAAAVGLYDPEEYTYEWNVSPIQIAPGTPSLAIGLKSHLFYEIKVTDKFGCFKSDKFWTEAYTNPKVETYTDPDTAYLQNPTVQFEYVNLDEDSISIINQYWDFGDESPTNELESPSHVFEEEGTYTIELTVYNTQGCDTIYYDSVLIKPVDLLIPNVFTPNGDGINDTFIISENQNTGDDGLKDTGLEYEAYDVINLYYRSSELVIFNRWGRIAYRSSDYQNDWDGGDLPDGVYFYVLKCYGAKSDDTFKGSVSIYGSGR